MSDLKFVDTHNLVAFLSKPAESKGFKEIVDFLNAYTIKYALTVNHTIYTSCIKQFWDTVKVKTINKEVPLQALVDRKKVIITESTIRRDLQLEDAEGIEYLPNTTIFEELARIGGPTKPIADEATNEEHVPTHSNDPLLSGEDSLKLNELMELCTNLQKKVLDLETSKSTQVEEITILKSRVKKLENKNKSRTHGLKRLYKAGLSTRVVSSKDEGLGKEDASKQGRKIHDIDADEDITLENVHDAEMFDVNDLHGDEVFVEKEAPDKDVSTADPVTTGSVSTASPTEVTTAVELTLAQTLAELKSARLSTQGICFREPSEATITTTPTIIVVPKPPQDKGKGIMTDEEPVLQAEEEEEEEERLAREKAQHIEDANIAWDDIQAKIDANYQLAERLQAEEQE
ncbi:hypothetical protein Tco_0856282 [Tanacetum coccineum]|uniref:Xylulose kinase-1 n=1 Tax=Tanacetum coccineum TaxID=301880 RepID=A0ABQ5B2V6_9ASTR